MQNQHVSENQMGFLSNVNVSLFSPKLKVKIKRRGKKTERNNQKNEKKKRKKIGFFSAIGSFIAAQWHEITDTLTRFFRVD